MRPLLLLLLLTGCASTELYEDDGVACVDGNVVTVTLDACLAPACDVLVSASCEATGDADAVQIRSSFVIRRRERAGCDKVCLDATVKCGLPVLGPDTDPILTLGESSAPRSELACDESP